MYETNSHHFCIHNFTNVGGCNKVAIDPSTDEKTYELTVNRLRLNQNFKNDEATLNIQFSILNGMLVFRSENDFESFVLGLQDYSLDSLELAWGYLSYRRHHQLEQQIDESIQNNTTLPRVDDVYFGTAVNPNGFVKINNWLFRILPESRKCIVSTNFNAETIGAMLSDPNSTRFMHFTFDDDIFYLLENGLSPQEDNNDGKQAAACSEKKAKCAGNCKESKESIYCSNNSGVEYQYKYNVFHKYNPFGVWYNLKTNAIHLRKGPNQLLFWKTPTDYDLAYKYSYKIRCRGSANVEQIFLSSLPFTTQYRFSNHNSVEQFYYHGTRALHKYIAYTEWKIKSACAGSPLPTVSITFIMSQQQ